MSFDVPREGELYSEQVFARSYGLIDAGIWGSLDRLRLDAWLRFFVTRHEKYFAASVLDSLIVRTSPQTDAMVRQLFERVLPDARRELPAAALLPDDLLLRLREVDEPTVRIVPVLSPSDSPASSGTFLTRLLRRVLQIQERWIIWPNQIPQAIRRGVSTFIFVDDFAGTGLQFTDFASAYQLSARVGSSAALYAPLAAHQSALTLIGKNFPNFPVLPVEQLSSRHQLFSRDSPAFNDGVNTPFSAGHFYDELIHDRRLDIPKRLRRGFGRLALTYVFAHGTPNNCLPLLWRRQTGCAALFER
jgi:hypothetical protein